MSREKPKRCLSTSCCADAFLPLAMNDMGPGFDRRRFLPFVVMHEFEGLLFSDCDAFARGVGRADLANVLHGIRDRFDTPEDINDSSITAPSKRVEALMPEYVKPLFGNLAALTIGLDAITNACPHFRSWRSELETRALLDVG